MRVRHTCTRPLLEAGGLRAAARHAARSLPRVGRWSRRRSALIEMGNVVVEVLHTPGHARAHRTSRDRQTRGQALVDSDRPHADGRRRDGPNSSIARTKERRNSTSALRCSGARSSRIWPGAFAHSVCGRRDKPASTIGFERSFNRTFRIEDRDAFVAAMLRDLPEPPANAAAIRARNLAG